MSAGAVVLYKIILEGGVPFNINNVHELIEPIYCLPCPH